MCTLTQEITGKKRYKKGTKIEDGEKIDVKICGFSVKRRELLGNRRKKGTKFHIVQVMINFDKS